MLRFDPFNEESRVDALHELNRMMKPFSKGTQLYDERDMTATLQPIWNFIGAIQGRDFRDRYGNTVLTYVDTDTNYKDDVMDSLKGLPKGRFFGNYVEQDSNIPDVREYAYILGFLLATTDDPSDPDYQNFVNKKFIGRYKCVFGSIAIPATDKKPAMTWYDVLKTIFTFIDRYPKHFGLTDGWGSEENQSITFNADPYPDFMNFPDDEVDHTVCKEIKKKKDAKNLKDEKLKEKKDSTNWTTKNILLLVFIGIALLFLVFNPVTFSLTNNLLSKDTPTKVGIILHGFIFVLLFLIILLIFRNKSTI
jgi:hypothetical protein